MIENDVKISNGYFNVFRVGYPETHSIVYNTFERVLTDIWEGE